MRSQSPAEWDPAIRCLKHGLQEKLFQQVVSVLTEQGSILEKGTIVDWMLIVAPSSMKD